MESRTRSTSPTHTEVNLKQEDPSPLPNKISAYYSLVFPHFTFYIQTLSVTIGRRCNPNPNAPTSSTSANSEPVQVDVDLGALKSVSRLHAKIEYDPEEDRFVLSVIGRNGAWVDGVWQGSGTKAPLGERSQIQIASRTFHFVLPPPPPPEDTPSPSSNSSTNRPRSPSLDITSISPPSSQPSHSPPPREPKLPTPPPEPQLGNSNHIARSTKANAKKRKKSDISDIPVPPPAAHRPEEIPPKPSLTYAQLIYRAIKAYDGKATLQEICAWIAKEYDYYRYTDTTAWISSVRHNLSSGRAFKKMERCGGDRGKGFFWALDEAHQHALEEQDTKSAATGSDAGGKTRKKDKGAASSEPALKRSVKGDKKGGALPPPLTSTPLPIKSSADPAVGASAASTSTSAPAATAISTATPTSPTPTPVPAASTPVPTTTTSTTTPVTTTTAGNLTSAAPTPSGVPAYTQQPMMTTTTTTTTTHNPYAVLTQSWGFHARPLQGTNTVSSSTSALAPAISTFNIPTAVTSTSNLPTVPATSTSTLAVVPAPPLPQTRTPAPTSARTSVPAAATAGSTTTANQASPSLPGAAATTVAAKAPAPTSSVPDVAIPIVLGPIPPTHPSYSATHPNNSAKEGYMILHERRLILDPDVFSSLTKEMLTELERMGARKAIDVLTGHMVRVLKERRKSRKSSRGRGRGGKGAGGPGRKSTPADSAMATPTASASPAPSATPRVDTPASSSATPAPMIVDSMPAQSSTSSAFVGDPGSPIIVVDSDDDEGPAAKKRKVDEGRVPLVIPTPVVPAAPTPLAPMTMS